MTERGTIYAIKNQERMAPEQGGALVIPNGFLTPGFIAAAACIGWRRDITRFQYDDAASHQGLFEAMQVPYKLTGIDGYAYRRVNQGANYSPIQMLQDADDVDRATSETNKSIRLRVQDAPGVSELCAVIGELHDNVRAHAEGMGFSMSLNWRPRDPVIEFSVADVGKGFYRECQRLGVPDVIDDASAIRWCLTERNTTKDKDYDELAQMMPEDAMGNPFGNDAETRAWHNGNHHQGLGLAKLMQLVTAYNGQIWIASGRAALISLPNTRQQEAQYQYGQFIEVPYWKGVAIACRLNISELGRPLEEEPFEEIVQDILNDIFI